LNAGAALVAAGRADDLGTGLALAAAAIDDGRALLTLERLVEFTNR
jgi:anthranilate phosphoribosyltransferase